jgi:hypothetical protein
LKDVLCIIWWELNSISKITIYDEKIVFIFLSSNWINIVLGKRSNIFAYK